MIKKKIVLKILKTILRDDKYIFIMNLRVKYYRLL